MTGEEPAQPGRRVQAEARSAFHRGLGGAAMTDAPVRTAPGRVVGGVLDPDLGRLTMADRVARGKAAGRRCPGKATRRSTRPRTGPTRSPSWSSRPSRGAGTGADPLRPDAGLPVRLLPRRGPADGQRPGRYAVHRPGRAGLRGRAPVQLRYLRLPRTEVPVRRQRLRRDAARAVGMGREAAGGQPGGGGPRQRLLAQAAPPDRDREHPDVPGDDAHVRWHEQHRRLVRPG